MRSYKTDIDFKKLLTWLTPLEVLKPKLLNFVFALCYSIQYQYSKTFKDFIDETELHLSITPQVGVLEYHLNRLYDSSLNRIYIEDGVSFPLTYLYQRAENKPVYLYTRAESKPVYLGLRSESGFDGVSFRVRIPSAIVANQPAIRAFVQKYKLASKTFDVIKL